MSAKTARNREALKNKFFETSGQNTGFFPTEKTWVVKSNVVYVHIEGKHVQIYFVSGDSLELACDSPELARETADAIVTWLNQ